MIMKHSWPGELNTATTLPLAKEVNGHSYDFILLEIKLNFDADPV